jgi:gliding motility-associated-like protein
MKKINKILISFLFGLVTTFGNAQCPINLGFEQTTPGTYIGAGNAYAVSGWTLSGNYANNAGVNYNCANLGAPYNLGANEFSIVTTPLTYNSNGGGCSFILGNSPFGGTRVARLGDNVSNYSRNKMSTTFNVTSLNTLFQFAFAGYYENPGHNCCDQPGLYLRVINACGGNTVASCSSMTLAANCGSLANVTFTACGPNGVMSNWQVKVIDLTPYIGGCVTIEAWTADCNFGGHYGTTFFDAMCGGQLIGQGLGGIPGGPIPGPVSFCSGSGVATIAAPAGYNSYQWYGPNGIISSPNGTMQILTVNNPIPGQTYTVQLVSQGGCQLMSTNTLNTSTISIAGIGSSPSCPLGSSGTATVQGNGSGSGYTYTWTNSTNSVVGTQSVAVGLPAGIYSVTISGLGTSMCGSASSTVSVGTATPLTQNTYKPFCNGQAYLNTIGGSNFQWYNGNTAITGSLGIAPNYTVTNPFNGAVYNLTYVNTQNCLSSVSFTLITSAPGLMTVSSTSVCPGLNNGTGTINLVPAAGAPPGVINFAVQNMSLTPAYTSTSGITSATQYTFNGFSAGQYSISAFDGSCFYNTFLNVNTHTFTPTLSPSSVVLCPGGAIAAGITFPTPSSIGQYTYSWTPNVFLAGNNPNFQSTIIWPSLSVGTQSNITYSVVITPTAINCPQTRTMTLLATNPPIPTITAIPNLCNNGTNYQILASPPGGVFSIPNGLIVPTATNLSIGTNTVTYTINVNGCTAMTTTSFQLNQFVPSTLTNSIAPLCVTSPTANLINIVQNTTGSWSGVNVVSNIFNPVGLSGVYTLTYNTLSTPNPTVCPSSTQLNVTVTNTVIPTMINPGPFCNNTSSFVLLANPNGGSWSNNSAVSSLGVVTPSLSSPSSSIVNYVVNVGPCINTNTFNIYPSTFNTASLTGIVPALCVSSNPFNLMSIVQNTTGIWSGLGVTQNSFNPTGLVTGTYVVTYNTSSTPNTSLCPDNRTTSISVFNPPMPNIASVGPMCSTDAPMQMTVSPSIGSWITTPYLNSNGILTPSLCAVGSNFVQYVIGTSTCNSQQTKVINVEMFVPSTIIGQIPDLCNTSLPISLNNYSNFSGLWSGPGVNGSVFNPYSANTGTITLVHNTASSPSGLCPSTSTTSVRVYSLQSPQITKPNIVCNNQLPFQLQVTPVGGLFGGNGSIVSLGGLVNPGYGSIGNNIVTYSITSGPCIAYAQTTITIEKLISANFDKYPKSVYCKGSEFPFDLNSLVQNPGYTWSGGSGLIGSMFYPNLANIGNNSVTYWTSSINGVCVDNSTMTIYVAGIPTVAVSVSDISGCVPMRVLFTTDKNDGEGTWKFDDGSESNGLYTSHTYTSNGTYVASFSYISGEGCAAKLVSTPSVSVFSKPVTNFIVDDILISEPKLTLNNKTDPLGFCTYTWSIPSMSFTSNEVNPTILFSKTGKYEITLTSSTSKDCKDWMTKWVEVKNDFNVSIPNTFTPNYDGLNDIFIPVFTSYGFDQRSYQLEIFDRWGSLIFTTNDYKKGWDGLYKLNPMKEEVYVYRIRFKTSDGNSIDKYGHVTLLR